MGYRPGFHLLEKFREMWYGRSRARPNLYGVASTKKRGVSMFKMLKWFSVSVLISLVVAIAVAFGWWGIFFRGGLLLPPGADIHRAIEGAGAMYLLLATFIIVRTWERRVAMLGNRGDDVKTVDPRIPFFMHLAMFGLAIFPLGLMAIEPRQEWVGGVVTMGVVAFIYCFLLSTALFMNNPKHDIWGKTDVPASLLRGAGEAGRQIAGPRS